ncbi:uncharacterized protein LOC112558219 isoform X2 [Pomacea canaliculata]|uniref:uncharacterized protein LOC112558219 isoform X2 n=1 Tax=Pomacea canaliculata TaxID=400727 RepID=UPI000D728E72|nr:uncharacterized protein LOC112558219 isoform X2 [Pomacea canaliculata]
MVVPRSNKAARRRTFLSVVMRVLTHLKTMTHLQITWAITIIVLTSQCLADPPLRAVPPANPNAYLRGVGGGESKVQTFTSVEELCEWLCERPHPVVSYGCPPSCSMASMNPWSKRSVRRRFDDFSFDDYLFMKLLGRNLGDKQ